MYVALQITAGLQKLQNCKGFGIVIADDGFYCILANILLIHISIFEFNMENMHIIVMHVFCIRYTQLLVNARLLTLLKL